MRRRWRWPGKLLGVPVTVVMPRTAPAVKRAATEGYGARIVPCEPTLAAREETVAAEIERHGFTLVHPFNDWNVIAGQGTAALELLDQAGPLDLVICPVGGGGLLAGTALAVKGRSPRDPGHRRRAGQGRRCPALARSRLDPALERPADDRRRPAHDLARPADLRRHLAARRPDRHRHRGRDPRRDAVRLGADQDRHRAVERRRGRPAVDRQARRRLLRVGVILSGGNVELTDYFTCSSPSKPVPSRWVSPFERAVD